MTPIDYSQMAFPKPGKKRREPIKRVGNREICDSKTAGGRREYRMRLTIAWTKQRGLCALCGLPVALEEATADHISPRGMGGGSRSDNQENIQAAHGVCNSNRGSKRI